MKNFNKRSVVSLGLLAVLLAGLVFTLTGCGFFNQAPTAEIKTTPEASDGKVNATVDEEITFDGSDSSDPNGDIASYDWDFDAENDDTDWTGTGDVQTHSYSQTGTYVVTLTVTDDGGKTDSDSVDVEVSSSS